MTESDLVLLDAADGVARLTIHRPDKLNALNLALLDRLRRRFAEVGTDPAIRAVVLTGTGSKAFVAGADIAEMSALRPEEARLFARAGQSIADAIDGGGKPVIAAVNGWALGGGCELALMCHLRVAAPGARFGQPEVGLGLIPGFGGTQRLARLIGEGRALELVLTGKPIGADTALAWGLVNRVARERDVVEEATLLAREIAAQGPVAVRLALAAVRGGLSMPLNEALAHEAALFGVGFGTADMREGTAAFLEKRSPSFTGR